MNLCKLNQLRSLLKLTSMIRTAKQKPLKEAAIREDAPAASPSFHIRNSF